MKKGFKRMKISEMPEETFNKTKQDVEKVEFCAGMLKWAIEEDKRYFWLWLEDLEEAVNKVLEPCKEAS